MIIETVPVNNLVDIGGETVTGHGYTSPGSTRRNTRSGATTSGRLWSRIGRGALFVGSVPPRSAVERVSTPEPRCTSPVARRICPCSSRPPGRRSSHARPRTPCPTVARRRRRRRGRRRIARRATQRETEHAPTTTRHCPSTRSCASRTRRETRPPGARVRFPACSPRHAASNNGGASRPPSQARHPRRPGRRPRTGARTHRNRAARRRHARARRPAPHGVGPATPSGLSTLGASMAGSDRRQARRVTTREGEATDAVEDPTRAAAARRNGNQPARLSQLVLKYDTEPGPDAADVDRLHRHVARERLDGYRPRRRTTATRFFWELVDVPRVLRRQISPR